MNPRHQRLEKVIFGLLVFLFLFSDCSLFEPQGNSHLILSCNMLSVSQVWLHPWQGWRLLMWHKVCALQQRLTQGLGIIQRKTSFKTPAGCVPDISEQRRIRAMWKVWYVFDNSDLAFISFYSACCFNTVVLYLFLYRQSVELAVWVEDSFC